MGGLVKGGRCPHYGGMDIMDVGQLRRGQQELGVCCDNSWVAGSHKRCRWHKPCRSMPGRITFSTDGSYFGLFLMTMQLLILNNF